MIPDPAAATRQQLLEASRDAVLVVDTDGMVVAQNREVERLFGWPHRDLRSQSVLRLLPARFHRVIELWPLPSADDSQQATVHLLATRRDASEFPVELTRSAIGDAGLMLITIRDDTAARQTRESLLREKELAVVTLESIGDAVVTTDTKSRICYLNPAAERLTGWRLAQAIGQPVTTVLNLISDSSRQLVEHPAVRCLREARPIDLAEGVLLLRRDGTEVAIGDSVSPITDRNGLTTGVVMVFHDVGERRRVSRELTYEATHDALTGLVNRSEFERQLARVLRESAATAYANPEHVLCCLDLDHFKEVNDSSGHAAGDKLLVTISALFGARMRRRDTLARLGGDEFGVLLEHCSIAEAEEIAESMRMAMQELRFEWGERQFTLGVSIGMIPISATSGAIATVMRQADAACYAAKEAGGNRVQVDASPPTAPNANLWAWQRRATRINDAIGDNTFQLLAQAIVPLTARDERARCEILVRLPGSHGQLEAPEVFLADADRRRLLPAIDRWVVQRTLAVLSSWRKDYPGSPLPICAINLSAATLEDEALIPTVEAALARTDIPAAALCFEIDEEAALSALAQTVRVVSQLRALGCTVTLENFGNSLHAFAQLKALSVDHLKLSGHHVQGLTSDPVSRTIVTAVHQLGAQLGLATIADGVESEAVVHELRTLGIDFAQGSAVSPPRPLIDSDGAVALPRIRIEA